MGLWDRATERLTLEPIFGPRPGFSPQTACDDVHPGGDIPFGSRCCCMVCHQSGMDHHPALRETATDKLKLKTWKPPEGGDQWSHLDTAEPTRYEPDRGDKPETRRERRARERGTRFVPGVERPD